MIIAISVTLFFIVLRFTVTLFNFISNPKLTRVNRSYTGLVSILIPVQNEADCILTLLKSIHDQDYQHYEVIIYDDQSADGTYSICSEFCERHSRFSIVKGNKTPTGWLGKNYACDQLAKKAKGEYFLFLDAGDVLSIRLINSAVHRMQLYKLGLLSLFANQQMQTFGEITTVPLLHFVLLNLLPLRLVRLTKMASIAAASGQFMLFDADSYTEKQWHKQVKDSNAAEVDLMKLVKGAGLNVEVLLANGMISCRQYQNYNEAINGLSKNLLSTFNYSIVGLLIYILLFIGGPLIIIATLDINLIFFMTGLIMLSRVMASLSAKQPVWYNLLLHPVLMANLTIIAFSAIQNQLKRRLKD